MGGGPWRARLSPTEQQKPAVSPAPHTSCPPVPAIGASPLFRFPGPSQLHDEGLGLTCHKQSTIWFLMSANGLWIHLPQPPPVSCSSAPHLSAPIQCFSTWHPRPQRPLELLQRLHQSTCSNGYECYVLLNTAWYCVFKYMYFVNQRILKLR